MWCWKQIGCTAPESIGRRFGIRVISRDSIKVSIEEAIREFRSGNWGSYFVDRVTLSWPLYPGCDEPTYLFQSDLGVYVHIGAYTKNINSLKVCSDENFISMGLMSEEGTHGATINIANATDYEMTHLEDKTCHGKYTSNPPNIIGAKQSDSFRVSPTAWGPIGPKGWIVYTMTVNGQKEKIKIFWDHPVGSKPTRYLCYSEPYAIEFEQVPPGPVTGTEQEVTIKLKNVFTDKPSVAISPDCNY
jgi:hypothetical protein